MAVSNNNVSVYSHRASHYGRPLSYTASFNNDQFYHYSINVHKNGLIELFINGERVHTAQGQADYSAVPLGIGGTGNWGSWDTNDKNRFDGAIDELRLYNRALSEAEVAALYELESLPPKPATPEPELALASATVVNGFVVGVNIDFGGWGYTTPPEVRIVGGGGSGATAKAVVTDGVISELTVLTPGIGYTSTPEVEIDPPPYPPKQALAKAEVVNGFVVGYEVSDGGRGYRSAPRVRLISETGSGAKAKAVVVDGAVTAIEVLSPGAGYAAGDTVEIDPPPYPPLRAAGQAEVVNGFVVGLTVVDGGRGYSFPPKVQLTGGDGTGAAAIAVVENGRVTGLTLTDAGADYAYAPEVVIDPPQPLLSIEATDGRGQVRIEATAHDGANCRLEGSDDLRDWSRIGNEFVAEGDTVSFKFEASLAKRFYRFVWLD